MRNCTPRVPLGRLLRRVPEYLFGRHESLNLPARQPFAEIAAPSESLFNPVFAQSAVKAGVSSYGTLFRHPQKSLLCQFPMDRGCKEPASRRSADCATTSDFPWRI